MTTSRVPNDVLLVGSLWFETEEQGLRAGAALGADANALPDGEVGDRRLWVGYLASRTYSEHPDLIETATPTRWNPGPEDEGRPASGPDFRWTFKFKPGVDSIDFGELHYADAALKSYEVFTKLRDEGTIAPGVRFQVSLPAITSATSQFFEEHERWPLVHDAYARSIGAEVEKMLKGIPAADLVIQFDIAWEVSDLSIGDEQYFPWWPRLSYEEKFRNHTDLVVELTKYVPEEVVLGFHWCYGNWGGWPMTAIDDLRLCVDLSNDTVRRSARTIDYVHMPVTLDPDPEFFAPLRDLEIGDTKVFLGLIHHEDGIQGSTRRIALAKQSLPRFGVAAVCGFSQEDPADWDDIFELHRASAKALHGSS